MATEVELKLLANVKAATDSVQGFAKSANSAVNSVSNAFTAMAGIAVAAIAGIGFKKMIDAAIEADDSVNALNTSLKLAGDFSAEASADFQSYASSIQATTKFTEDAVLANIALSKSYGLTNEQAKKVSKAALELATVQGVSLETATRQLTQTFEGQLGKLGKTVPALKGLTAEQLRAGQAADIINSQFNGAAAAAGGSFSGSLEIASNSLGEVTESLGKVITQSPVVIKVVKDVGKLFADLASFIDANQQPIANVVNKGIVLLVGAFAGAIEVINIFIKAVAIVERALIFLGKIVVEVVRYFALFEPLTLLFVGLGQSVALVYAGIAKLLQVMLLIPGSSKVLATMGVDSKQLSKELETAASNGVKFATSLTTDDIRDQLGKASGALDALDKGVVDSTESVVGGFEKAENAAIKYATSLQVEGKKSQVALGAAGLALKNNANGAAVQVELLKINTEELIKKVTDLASKNPFAGFFGKDKDLNKVFSDAKAQIDVLKNELSKDIAEGRLKLAKNKELAIKDAESQLKALQSESNKAILQGVSVSLINGIGQGAAGASKVISTVLSQTMGPVVGAIFDVLSQGPEKVKEMISGFIGAIPTIIENIILAIPALIQALIDAIPVLIEAILASIPTIIDGLIASIPRIIESLIAAIPRIIDSIITNIPRIIVAVIEAIPQIINAIITALPQIITSLAGLMPTIATRLTIEIIKNLPQIIKALVDGIVEMFKGTIGSIGDIGGSIGGFLGFSSGGMVPGSGNTDSVPTMLTPGEIVIPKDIANRMLGGDSVALSGGAGGVQAGGAGQMIQVILQVGEKQLAEAILNLNRQGFRTA